MTAKMGHRRKNVIMMQSALAKAVKLRYGMNVKVTRRKLSQIFRCLDNLNHIFTAYSVLADVDRNLDGFVDLRIAVR